jgi:4-aminobutyrate--pyruvate transaminase
MEERAILAHVKHVSSTFLRRLQRLEENPVVEETRGVGLIAAIQLRTANADAAAVKALAEDEGVIVRMLPGGNGVALSPPLIISEPEINDLFDRLESALQHAAVLNIGSGGQTTG